MNTKGAPARGDPDAKIAVIEFSDFQCPYCSRAVTDARADRAAVRRQGADRVQAPAARRCTRRRPPRTPRPRPLTARESSGRCTTRSSPTRREMSPERYREYARELGLDLARFDRDVADASVQAADRRRRRARPSGSASSGTPAFFVNGRFVRARCRSRRSRSCSTRSSGRRRADDQSAPAARVDRHAVDPHLVHEQRVVADRDLAALLIRAHLDQQALAGPEARPRASRRRRACRRWASGTRSRRARRTARRSSARAIVGSSAARRARLR